MRILAQSIERTQKINYASVALETLPMLLGRLRELQQQVVLVSSRCNGCRLLPQVAPCSRSSW